MIIQRCKIDGVLSITLKSFEDDRGYFRESYQNARYAEAGIREEFVQQNLSRSGKNVLRGLHFQKDQAQIMTVISGTVFDVVVDIREGSKTFGSWVAFEVSATKGPNQIYMPAGTAHGFCVLSESADLHYSVSQLYNPSDEGGIRFDDQELGITWPLQNPIVAQKDLAFPGFKEAVRLLPY